MQIQTVLKPWRLGILGHWGWAVVLLLLVAALTIPWVDHFPPYTDEWFFLYTSGWLEDGPYSAAEIVDAVQRYTPDHMPGYSMVMSVWGSLTGWEVELGRVLTILTGLLFLAVGYRLAHDFVAPIAGLMALIVFASTAFFNIYFTYMRQFTLLPLLAGLVLWLYLRITHRLRRARPSDYVLLGAAVFWMLNTHLFSALFLLMLGIYHLFFAAKNRAWLWTSATVIVAVALMLPFILPMTSIINIVEDDRARRSVDGLGALHAWLTAYLNGQVILLPLALAGLFVGVRKSGLRLKPWLAMPPIYMLLLFAVAQMTTWVEPAAVHYHLAIWPPFVLLVVFGLYGWYCLHRALFLLAMCWAIAGFAYHSSVQSWRYNVLFREYHTTPPVQVLSRLAQRAEPRPALIGHSISGLHKWMLEFRGKFFFPEFIDYSQSDHYFERHGIVQYILDADLAALTSKVGEIADTEPSVWIYYQSLRADAALQAEVQALLDRENYERCGSEHIGRDTVIDQYMWKALDCVSPRLVSNHRGEIVDYEFYGAKIDAADKRLYIIDKWTAAQDVITEPYKLSYQLLSAERELGARLDLQLAHPDKLRMFHIDVSGLALDEFELVTILYHAETGERQLWLDDAGDAAEFQRLIPIVGS